jgi:hypothetical protein
MWNKLKAFWASLPHQVQAAVVAFATAAGTVLGEELQALASGQQSFTVATVKHDLLAALAAGLLALRAFYMFPSRPQQPPDPPTPVNAAVGK